MPPVAAAVLVVAGEADSDRAGEVYVEAVAAWAEVVVAAWAAEAADSDQFGQEQRDSVKGGD
jgi:hypothetical protein